MSYPPHVTARESVELLVALAQAFASRFEILVRGEVRLHDRTGLVLCYCAFEFFYSSFQCGDLVLGRHVDAMSELFLSAVAKMVLRARWLISSRFLYRSASCEYQGRFSWRYAWQ